MIELSDIYHLINKYGYIKDINFSRKALYDEFYDFDLKLVLCKFPCYDDNDVLSIKFIGIKDLKLNDFNNLFRIVLDIVPIFELQLEDLNYSIKEIENDIISFKCKDIIIEDYEKSNYSY